MLICFYSIVDIYSIHKLVKFNLKKIKMSKMTIWKFCQKYLEVSVGLHESNNLPSSLGTVPVRQEKDLYLFPVVSLVIITVWASEIFPPVSLLRTNTYLIVSSSASSMKISLVKEKIEFGKLLWKAPTWLFYIKKLICSYH